VILLAGIWDIAVVIVCMLCAAVFDDGDENTLRRSKLCLKGSRHFMKSEVSMHFTRSHNNHRVVGDDDMRILAFLVVNIAHLFCAF